jgi:mannosyltransferase
LAHPAEGAPPRSGALDPVFLWSCLALAVAAALRLYRLGQNSFWVDEYDSLVTARLSMAGIPSAALRVLQPPFYFWLLHLAIKVFGDSESAGRLISAFAGAATVPLTALLIRGLGESNRVAILGAMALALSPLHLWYSQEARPYALLGCLGVGSLVFLLRALRTGSTLAWAGFAGLATLAVLTHVIGLVFPLIGWLWGFRMRRCALVVRRLFASTVLIVTLTAPFWYRLPQAVVALQGTGSPPRRLTGLEIPYTLFTYLVGYSFGPAVREIQDQGPLAAVLAHPTQSALGVVVLLTLMALALRLRSNAAKNLALLCLLPMTATWVGAAFTGKAYNVRYTLPGLIGFVGLVAVGLSKLGRARRVIAIGLVAGLFLWADAQWFFTRRYWKEDSRSAIAWLRGQLPPGSRIAVAPGYQTGVLTYYAQRGRAAFVFDSLPESARSVGPHLPDALLITRLYHLPHWKEIVRSLDPNGSALPPSVQLVGYRAFLAPR